MISRSLRGIGRSNSCVISGCFVIFSSIGRGESETPAVCPLVSVLGMVSGDTLEMFLGFLVSVGLDREAVFGRASDGEMREFGGDDADIEVGQSFGLFEREELELGGVEQGKGL